MLQLLGPWFFPITLRPSLQYEEHLQDLFCINNVLETLSPQLIICFKATKKSVKNVFYTDWSRSISSPSILHLSSGCGVVWSIWDCRHCPHGLVCKQGNHWAIMNNAASVPTRSHLSRSHWPGCLQPCTEQLCNRKHPTHVPATWLKNGPPKVFQKPLLISADYSPVPPYALQYFWNTFGFNMKNSLQPIDKVVEIQGHKCSNQYLFCS